MVAVKGKLPDNGIADFSVIFTLSSCQNKKVCCCTVQVFTLSHTVSKKKKKTKGFMGMWITVKVSFGRDRISKQDFFFIFFGSM